MRYQAPLGYYYKLDNNCVRWSDECGTIVTNHTELNLEEESMGLESWNDYIGKSWLKAEDVESEDQAFAVVSVTLSEEDDRPVLSLERDEAKYQFSLNVTNSNKCKEFVSSPKALVGKKIYFKKVNVMSPSTKKEVESLRIYQIV